MRKGSAIWPVANPIPSGDAATGIQSQRIRQGTNHDCGGENCRGQPGAHEPKVWASILDVMYACFARATHTAQFEQMSVDVRIITLSRAGFQFHPEEGEDLSVRCLRNSATAYTVASEGISEKWRPKDLGTARPP